MSLFTKLGNDIASPVDAAGNYRSVDNIDFQRWMTEVERVFSAFQAGGGIIFPDLATANASLAYAQNQMAWVMGDPTPANNGVYRKIGASGSGSWARMGDLPFAMIPLANAGAGTADAIVATPMLPLPTAPGAALLTVNILADNTGNVTINGKPLRTNSGNEIAAGGLTAGSIHAFLDLGDHFRLLSDQASASVLAGAEAARDEAVSAASSVQSTQTSRAYAVASYHPAVAPDFIETAGYAAAGDGGGARYVSNGTSTGDLVITLSDGVTEAGYDLATDAPNTRMFGGGTGNPSTDGGALEKLIAYVAARGLSGADINIERGSYALSGGITPYSGNRWKFNGSTLNFPGVTNADLVLTAQGGRAHVACEGSVRGALPALSTNVSRGDFVVPFVSAHGLAPNDVFQIYNPTDNSWSSERPSYRAGELCRVMVVVDATNVWVDRGLYENYAAADVTLSAFDTWSGSIEDVHVIGNGLKTAITYGVVVDFAKDVTLQNVSSAKVSYNTHTINRTIDFRVDGCRGAEDGTADFGGDYGLGVYSSQRGLITNSHFIAARHAIVHGNIDGSVPFRDIHYRYCSARSTLTGQSSWDWHSIGDHCSAEYCTAFNGMNDGVKNMTVRNCHLHNVVGETTCYIASNQVGGTTRLIDNTYVVDGVYAPATAAGIIHLANSTSHTYLREDKFYDIDGVSIRGDGQRSKNIVAIWTTNATYAASASITRIDDPDANETREQVLHAHGGNGSPIAAKYYTIGNVKRKRRSDPTFCPVS